MFQYKVFFRSALPGSILTRRTKIRGIVAISTLPLDTSACSNSKGIGKRGFELGTLNETFILS